jgi:hypothetical protein
MNVDAIIKWTNRIALFSIALLIYWVFIFISITVFGFKVFRENTTESFYLSILGILALLGGSMIVNIMFNLTKISQSHGQNPSAPAKMKSIIFIIGFIIGFPALFGLLFAGDLYTSYKKEKIIKQAAQSLVNENQKIMEQFSQYNYDLSWITKANNNIKLLEKIDESFPNVELIVQDEIEGKPVFLAFSGYYYEKITEKVNHIYSCSSKERAYLSDAFEGKLDSRFSSSGGHYELYYPVKIGSKIIILYLSEKQRYGKIGS